MTVAVVEAPARSGDDIEEPLLLRTPGDEGDAHPSNYWACVFNMTKAVVGAGMMALPRACALLGAWFGFGMLGVVGIMTWFSISRGLVHPAAKLADASHGALPCYSHLVRAYLGNFPARLLTAFILANNMGQAVLFVDIMADVLLGSASSPGIFVDLVKELQVPAWALEWLLYRPFFLAVFMLLVVGPISLQRSMASLGKLNIFGLVALAALGLSVVWLAVAAFLQGKAFLPRTWPDTEALEDGGGSWVLAALSLLPVILTADNCHLNVMPLADMMSPFSQRSMDGVAAMALAICTVFYALFAAGAYAAFGADVQDDVLKNLNPSAMQPLLGVVQSYFVAYIVRIAYVVSLLGSVALSIFPLRDALVDAVCKNGRLCKEFTREKYFGRMTAGILLLVYIVAAAVPSIWAIIGFIGSVSSPGVSFVFPALVMFTYGRSCTAGTQAVCTLGASVLLSVGLGVAINGILRPL